MLDYFKSPGIDGLKVAIEEEKKSLYRIPKSFEEIKNQLVIIKSAKNANDNAKHRRILMEENLDTNSAAVSSGKPLAQP